MRWCSVDCAGSLLLHCRAPADWRLPAVHCLCRLAGWLLAAPAEWHAAATPLLQRSCLARLRCSSAASSEDIIVSSSSLSLKTEMAAMHARCPAWAGGGAAAAVRAGLAGGVSAVRSIMSAPAAGGAGHAGRAAGGFAGLTSAAAAAGACNGGGGAATARQDAGRKATQPLLRCCLGISGHQRRLAAVGLSPVASGGAHTPSRTGTTTKLVAGASSIE